MVILKLKFSYTPMYAKGKYNDVNWVLSIVDEPRVIFQPMFLPLWSFLHLLHFNLKYNYIIINKTHDYLFVKIKCTSILF